MPRVIDIAKRYCIVNENGQALEVDDWDSGHSEPHLGDLNYKSNQIWIFRSHPISHDGYWIIHKETDRILILREYSGVTVDCNEGRFDFHRLYSADFAKGLGPDETRPWIIETCQVGEEYNFRLRCRLNTHDYYLGLPKYCKDSLPPVVLAPLEEDQERIIDNFYWSLKEVPDDPKPDDPKPEDPKPEDPKSTIPGVLLSSPAYMIREMCSAIADSQRALDAAALETQKTLREKYPELAEIGYQVTWYQIPEVTMEIKVAVHFEETSDNETKFFVSPFNARYQSQFKFAGDGSSNIKLRLVPIPPPVGAELSEEGELQ